MHKRKVGIILAAGENKRLQAVTEAYHKPLVGVNGLPAIAYSIRACLPYTDEIIIVSSPVLLAKLKRFINSYTGQSKNISYAIQYEPKGMGDALRVALETLEDDCEVVILAADNVMTEIRNVKGVLNLAKKWGMGFTFLSMAGEKAKNFSVIYTGRLIEKPKFIFKSSLYDCWCGPVAFDSSTELLKRIEPDMVPIMNKYIKEKRYNYKRLSGQWFDIGTPQSLKEAENYFKRSNNALDKSL